MTITLIRKRSFMPTEPSTLSQWTFTRAFEHDYRWRATVPSLITEAQTLLREKNLAPQFAPEMPPLKDGLQGYIKQPFRVLYLWVPDWAMSEDAGKFVLRIDTMTRPMAVHAH
jgi:hypothetical protein